MAFPFKNNKKNSTPFIALINRAARRESPVALPNGSESWWKKAWTTGKQNPKKTPELQDMRSLFFEALEPRILMSADLSYVDSTDLANDPANALVFDFTLVAEQDNTGDFVLNLYETADPGNLLGSHNLTDTLDFNVTIARDDLGLGDTTLDVAGDTLRIDFDSFELAGFADFINANGGMLDFAFSGGKDLSILQDIGIPLTFGNDLVTLESDGTDVDAAVVGFNLAVHSTSDILVDAGFIDFSAKSLIVDSDSEVDVLDTTLVDAASLTLTSGTPLTVTGDADSADFLQLPSATISVTDSVLNADAILLAATVTANVTINSADAFDGALNFTEVVLFASSNVTIDSAQVHATAGNLTVNAISTVTTTLQRAPDSDNDTSTDAGFAVAIVSSEAIVDITDSSQLTASGTVAVNATNTVTSNTTADGTLGSSSSAGAMVAVTVLLGDTEVGVADSHVQGANVALAATTNRTVNTTAKATFQGASDGSNNQRSESTLRDTNQDGDATTDDTASTAEGDVDFAATVAVSVVTGHTWATVADSDVIADSGTVAITSSATHNITTTADGGTTDDTAPGVGVGVHIVESKALISGVTTLDAPSGVTVQALMPSSTFTVLAKSGAGDDSQLSFAGALALNVTIADNYAQIDADAVIDLGDSNLTLIAHSITNSFSIADAAVAGGDDSAGIGASVAINFAENETKALINANAAINNAHDLMLTAISDHGMTTTATGGGSGGTAITPVAALSFATYSTEAKVASGNVLDIDGNLTLLADHTDAVTTTATGKTVGSDVAIGASFALAVHTASATAVLERNVMAGGTVGLTGRTRAKTDTTANAAAKGSDSNGGSVNGQASDQRSGGDSQGAAHGGDSTSGTGSTPSAETSDGAVVVAAAVAISVVDSDSAATIDTGVFITANGVVTLLAENNTDTITKASGTALNADTAGVGAAVALNYVDIDNAAVVGTNSSINSGGISVQARMLDVGGESLDTHTSLVEAKSGAGAEDVGVAGSVAINLVDVDTTARIGTGVSLTPNDGDVTVKALANTTNNADALPEGKASGADAGVGAALAFQRVDTTTLAEIMSGGSMAGSAGNLRVEAIGSHLTQSNATHGAKGDSLAIGGAVTVALVTNETIARIESGGAYNKIT